MNIEKPKKDLFFIAEALSHIRVINLVLEFSENIYQPSSLKLFNTHSIYIKSNEISEIIFLPDETEKDVSIQVNQQLNTLSIRLPLSNFSIKSLKEISPWSAVYIDPNSDFCCGFCLCFLLNKDQIKHWRNLPSDNWVDMMDYWVCCKEKYNAFGNYGMLQKIKSLSDSGIIFVGLSYFLISEKNLQNIKVEKNKALCNFCHMNIGILIEDGIKLYKWKLAEKNMEKIISFDIDIFISAELLALIEIYPDHKFDICNEESGKCILKIWVFNSDLRITNGSFYTSDVNISNKTYNKFPGVRVMKVFYMLIQDTNIKLNFNNISFHSEMVESLLYSLKKSNSLIPESMRQFDIWNIGYLKRY
ncbi:hypothetical protein PNEG_00117 [Pneumocystis murina B123]|uniref:Ubiquitin-conjugating enzyme E2C-binding protein n=1 Tax=Pneumocystis murina (strain B123) TaxID=1069680 RepID=M7PCP3_PNEMU|nr:hypothetical protein PNEG_00117 [Pneumocystis murina B123]EMR11680.1 hypothetical protein PNEG_00117 [Pneumocystis murina B123]